MPVVEAVVGVAAAAAVGAASAASAFVSSRREWWKLEHRPADHPLKCDFRDALGLVRDMAFTSKDVTKHAKKAQLWWHPDKDPSLPADSFHYFQKITNILKNPTTRRAYISHVEKFGRVTALSIEEVNKLFLDDFDGHTPIKAGIKVLIQNLQRQPELNGKEADVLGWLEDQLRWKVQVCIAENHTKTLALKTENLEPVVPSPSEVDSMCHLFLDNSGSMKKHMTLAKDITTQFFPKFSMTCTSVHLIGTKGGAHASRQIFKDPSELDADKEWEVMQNWKAEAGGTYLWEYIYGQVEKYADFAHEVIIVTDGYDNGSTSGFEGLKGFNQLMGKIKGKKIRISLMLIGSDLSESSANSYRDLCMATGGTYFNCASEKTFDLAVEKFAAPLLWQEGERDRAALLQRRAYEKAVTNGTAERFDWYLMIEDEIGSTGLRNGSNGNNSSSSAGYPEPVQPRPHLFCPGGNVTVRSYT